MASGGRLKGKGGILISLGIVALSLAIAYVSMVSIVEPQRYDLSVGDIAEHTITASKDVEDQVETDRLMAEARARVQDVYKRDDAITNQSIDKLGGLLGLAEQMRADRQAYLEERRQSGIRWSEDNTAQEPMVPAYQLNAWVADFGSQLVPILYPDEAGETPLPTDSQIKALLECSDEEFGSLRNILLARFDEVLIGSGAQSGLREEELQGTLSSLQMDLELAMLNWELRRFAAFVYGELIVPNSFVDEEETERLREAALSSVEPVMYKKGQNIVRAGERVTENQIAMLEALGLLKDNDRPDTALYVGMGVLVVLLGATASLYLWNATDRAALTPKNALLISAALLIGLVAALAMRQIDVYLMPMHFAIMAIAILISPRIALSFNLLMGVVIGVFASGSEGAFSSTMLQTLIVSQVGGIVAALTLGKVQRRTTLMLCGLYTAIASGAATIGIGLMTNLNIDVTLKHAGFVAIGAMLSAVLAIGFLPLFESSFSIMTQQKLLELSNPNQPLLRMLQLEAPGTYHHSLLVANLAEAAADAVGANALLCRVGAYYHDVGKVKRPMYFKENQLDDLNPHDSMSPQVSAAILAEHVRDGRQMAEKEKLPKPIIDMIMQHHGTTTMAYFYYRAQQLAQDTDEQVLQEDFRYDGPRPQSKEAAIVFLADSVEAAVRSLKDHSSDNIQAMIAKLVGERMQDGQLADVPLTLKDFHDIQLAFMRVLGGIYHTRVEYPELAKKDGAAVAVKERL